WSWAATLQVRCSIATLLRGRFPMIRLPHQMEAVDCAADEFPGVPAVRTVCAVLCTSVELAPARHSGRVRRQISSVSKSRSKRRGRVPTKWVVAKRSSPGAAGSHRISVIQSFISSNCREYDSGVSLDGNLALP